MQREYVMNLSFAGQYINDPVILVNRGSHIFWNCTIKKQFTEVDFFSYPYF